MVSNIGDQFQDKWKQNPWYPNVPPQLIPTPNPNELFEAWQKHYPPITREEFNSLQKEVQEMREALKKAKEHDIKTGTPDCEMESKIAILRKVAEAVGVNLDDILKPKPTT